MNTKQNISKKPKANRNQSIKKDNHRSQSKNNLTKKATADSDSNGLVDGSEFKGYKLFNKGKPLLLTDKRGQAISDKTSQKWNAVAARKYKLLVKKNTTSEDSYRILTFKKSGILSDAGKWKNGRALSKQGLEKVFNLDINGDSIVEGKKLINAGAATFSISGTPKVNQTVSLRLDKDDPDGNRPASVIWQVSKTGKDWINTSAKKLFKIPSSLENFKLRGSIKYIDRDGFVEKAYTQLLEVPAENNGNASFLIVGTPEVGQTLSLSRSTADPDGDGTTNIEWHTSKDGVTWINQGAADSFTIPQNLEGHRISAHISYVDGQGFNELTQTDDLTIPFVDNGDASFLIVGTPEVGQTLSLSRSTADPDGDGTTNIEWHTSKDGVTWINQGAADSFTIPQNLEGHRISAHISYVDGQGFNELTQTDDLTIPFVDNGDASFLIVGTPEVGQTLSLSRSTADPDGDGTTNIEWHTSKDGVTWINQGAADSFTIPQNLEGHRISAHISYVDGQGFNELTQTDDLTIPFVDNGDASFLIVGTPEVGQTLSLSRSTADPDGDGTTNIEWHTSKDGVTWINQGAADSFTIPQNLEGHRISAHISYVDGQGFNELTQTDDLTIPFVDNGDASFLIVGTPEVGQTLSLSRSTSDPDGDGTTNIEWHTSKDGVTWINQGAADSFTIPQNLEGHRISAHISYVDGQGFNELTQTDDLTIPFVDNGDASFLIVGTPEVGQTLSLSRSTSDPDGDGTTNIEWHTSKDGVTWINQGAADNFSIPQNLEGQRISAHISYVDGQGFNELTQTDDLTIPFIDNGDASFLIVGTPEVGQWVTYTQTAVDPDGDGDLSVSWQTSLDSVNWNEISTSDYLQIGTDMAGKELIAVLQYTDGEGFKESIDTDITSISGRPVSNPEASDDYAQNSNTTGQLSINSSTSGTLENVGDHDWFAINLQAGVRYQFNLDGNSLDDPYLYLRNSSSSLISYNDDKSISSFDSQIIYTATNTGTHYLDAGSYYDAYTGNYTLSANELSAPKPGFNNNDGYGHVNAQRAFEQLLDISLPSVEELGDNLWGIDNINAPEVWNGGNGFSGSTGAGATIAVIDTGVDLDHPEFSDRIVSGYDFVDGDSVADDGNGHGTHVAGTIAGANDGQGITGVAYDAKIMPLRVLDNDGYGWNSDIVSAILWAADEGAGVINMSLGGGGYSQALADAIRYASDRGSVVVMAAGNSGGSSPENPATEAINHGIAVGAVDRNRSMPGFSNRAGNTQLDYVTAPGVNIYSAVPGGGYATLNGTSMATPHVAGIAGLLKSHNSNLTATAIEDLLTGSASNSTSSSSSFMSNPSPERFQSQDLITRQTLSTFTNKQLKGTLIASIDGNSNERRSTVRSFKKDDIDGIKSFDVVKTSRNSFAILELSKSVDRTGILNELLSTDQFNYFEFDQQLSII